MWCLGGAKVFGPASPARLAGRGRNIVGWSDLAVTSKIINR